MEKVLFKSKWITLKQTELGFQYLERNGVNSIALFLTRWNSDKFEVLIRMQPMPLDNSKNVKLYPCPITGGNYENKPLIEIAQQEALEEAGYKILLNDIKYLGNYFVGTQTNEVVSMFVSNVTSLKPEKITTDGTIHEKMSYNVWKDIDFLKKCKYSACLIAHPLICDTERKMFNNS